ncbi:MAG: class I SAM-dependent methyltransferase [Methylophilaceae bacterium]
MQTTTQDTWLETTLGQYLLTHEQKIYDAAVSDIFGFNAVQIGLPQINFLENSRIPHILRTDKLLGNLLCESDYLPFAENCIDLLCLPHALEFSENPHQTLREAGRVLVPEGYLLLTGFNPLSAWGVKNWLSKESTYPWHGQFFSMSRIKDWLALLGLEFVEAQFCCYELPINDEKWLNRFQFMDKIGSKWWPMVGGLYFIVAKKRVVNMTLLKPNWKQHSLKSRLVVSSSKKAKPSQKIKQTDA